VSAIANEELVQRSLGGRRTPANAGQRSGEAFWLNGLEQRVEGVHLERAHRVLIVRGRESDLRHVLDPVQQSHGAGVARGKLASLDSSWARMHRIHISWASSALRTNARAARPGAVGVAK